MRHTKVIILMSLLLMLLMTTMAYANDRRNLVEQFIREHSIVTSGGNIRYTNSTVRAYVRETADDRFNEAVVLADGVTVVYYDINSIDILYRQASRFYENRRVGERVGNITENLSVEANTEAASIMLSGFKPIIELVIGVIVILITFGMTLFSAFDICYIAFPVFRNKCEDMKQSGDTAMTKKSANGDVSLRWITQDAQYAVTQGTIDSGKSPWALYFKQRVMSYIFLGITLFILLTGNISIITDLAIRAVSGIIDVLTGLSS